MPLYEFECGECGARFEVLAREGEEVSCPGCSASSPRRLYSPPGHVGAARMSRAARRDSDSRRSEREAARKERFVARRRKGRGD